MSIELLPAITFILITTLTPGPNNITCTALGIHLGYRQTLPFMFGIMLGVFCVMSLCAFFASVILTQLPEIQKYLQIVGAFYIIWLAVALIGNTDLQQNKVAAHKLFIRGFLLQFVNPKGIIYGLTLYTSFFAAWSGYTEMLLMSVILLSLQTLFANSVWTLLGSAAKKFLENQRIKQVISIVLSAILLAIAFDLFSSQII